MGPRVGLGGCGKSRPQPGFEPRTVQPVASRYTDCDIPARGFVVVKEQKIRLLKPNEKNMFYYVSNIYTKYHNYSR
jgi:hypothetical protein